MRIVDCHCHIYPDSLAKRAFEGISSFYDFEPSGPAGDRGTVDDMKALESEAGIEHQIVFSVATNPHQVASVNRFIAESVKSANGSLTGLGTVHPDSEDPEGDIENIISLGLKGVKIHPDFQCAAADDPRYMRIYEMCEGRLPVLIHCGDYRKDYSNPGRILRVIESFQSLTVVGAHFGGWSVWDEAEKLLPGHGNFYVDCSSTCGYTGRERFASLIKAYGADRVLFGTDYPMWTPREELENLLSIGLGDDEIALITHKNAEKIFGIGKNGAK